MSERYSDLGCTTFPESVDVITRMEDPNTAEDFRNIDIYYSYINNGNLDAAEEILSKDNDRLRHMLFDASKFNKLQDAVIAVERLFSEDIEDFISSVSDYKGIWSAGTQYDKYNVVSYTVNGATLWYIALQAGIPVGTVPTNTDYWGVVNSKGDNGIGMTPKGVYNASTTYSQYDLVSYVSGSDAYIFYSLVDANTGNTPNPEEDTAYWAKMSLVSIDTTAAAILQDVKINGVAYDSTTNSFTLATSDIGAAEASHKHTGYLEAFRLTNQVISGWSYLGDETPYEGYPYRGKFGLNGVTSDFYDHYDDYSVDVILEPKWASSGKIACVTEPASGGGTSCVYIYASEELGDITALTITGTRVVS